MHFLPDVYVPCDICGGQRYGRETLDIRYKGKNIHQVLTMTVENATEFFANVPVLQRKLQTMMDVGLSYITLGQNATTLSGGEAQRIKLARELSKRDTGSTLYILDEPTTVKTADWIVDMGPEGGEGGGTVVASGSPEDIIKCKGSHTAHYLKRLLK